MNFLFLLFALFLITGCQQQEKPRQYTEVVTHAPQSQAMQVADQKPPDNPHAGIDMGANITPEARANLRKMLAEGQDPHAGLNISNKAKPE